MVLRFCEYTFEYSYTLHCCGGDSMLSVFFTPDVGCKFDQVGQLTSYTKSTPKGSLSEAKAEPFCFDEEPCLGI